jgi:hypothetical protein
MGRNLVGRPARPLPSFRFFGFIQALLDLLGRALIAGRQCPQHTLGTIVLHLIYLGARRLGEVTPIPPIISRLARHLYAGRRCRCSNVPSIATISLLNKAARRADARAGNDRQRGPPVPWQQGRATCVARSRSGCTSFDVVSQNFVLGVKF